jgi:hypothetical protein
MVADAQRARLDANIMWYEHLAQCLGQHGRALRDVPHVVQLNKSDLAGVSDADELRAALKLPEEVPILAADAVRGAGVFDVLKGAGKVCITGYCYGGTMSWLAAARLDGLAAASCYYGGNIAQMVGLKPQCPTICHFGAKDAHIPLVGAVDKIEAAHPDVPVYVYDAGHGFARKNSADYDAASDRLAFERTLDLFGRAG